LAFPKASRKIEHDEKPKGRRMAKGQKPTINDVARLSGVSKKTVSRVINKSPLLNQATREKVEAVIAQLEYVPNPQARALALRRNFLIGLVHDNPNAQMVLGVQEGILDTIRNTEFALVVQPVDRHSPTLLEDIPRFIEQQRLYGIMLLPPLSENDELARLCLAARWSAWGRQGWTTMPISSPRTTSRR
jgi:LacI family transcriptional regulator